MLLELIGLKKVLLSVGLILVFIFVMGNIACLAPLTDQTREIPVGSDAPSEVTESFGDYKTIDYFNGHFVSSGPIEMNQTAQLTLSICPSVDMQNAEVSFTLPWGIELVEGSLQQDLGSICSGEERDVSITVKMVGLTDCRNLKATVTAQSGEMDLKKSYYYVPYSVETYSMDTTQKTSILQSDGRNVLLTPLVSIPSFQEDSTENLGSSVDVDTYGDPGTISVHGKFYYQNENGGTSPVRGAMVKLYDRRPDGSSCLQTTMTALDGSYFFQNVDNNDESGGRDLTVIVYSESGPVTVCYKESGYAYLYGWTGNVGDDLSSGTYDMQTLYLTANSPAIQAMDAVKREYDWLYWRTGWERSQIMILWPYGDWPCSRGDRIDLPNDHSTWDSSTLYHEYGHCIMYTLYGNRFPQTSVSDMSHYIFSEKDGGFALTEGWAEFLECAVEDNSNDLRGYYNGHGGDIETNDWHNCMDCGDRDGACVEGSVASVLWDIYDSGHACDDTIENQFSKIFAIMKDCRPADINAFLNAWKDREYGQDTVLYHIVDMYGVAGFQPPEVDAVISSVSYPSSMTGGETDSASITVENTGTRSWSSSDLIRLGCSNSDAVAFSPSGSNRIYLPSGVTIAPGATYTFTFPLQAPTTAGTYSPQYRMVWDGQRWFGSSVSRTVSVTGAPPFINVEEDPTMVSPTLTAEKTPVVPVDDEKVNASDVGLIVVENTTIDAIAVSNNGSEWLSLVGNENSTISGSDQATDPLADALNDTMATPDCVDLNVTVASNEDSQEVSEFP